MGSVLEQDIGSRLPTMVVERSQYTALSVGKFSGPEFHPSSPGLSISESSEGLQVSHRIPQISEVIGNHPNAGRQPSETVRWRLFPKILGGSSSGCPISSR